MQWKKYWLPIIIIFKRFYRSNRKFSTMNFFFFFAETKIYNEIQTIVILRVHYKKKLYIKRSE